GAGPVARADRAADEAEERRHPQRDADEPDERRGLRLVGEEVGGHGGRDREERDRDDDGAHDPTAPEGLSLDGLELGRLSLALLALLLLLALPLLAHCDLRSGRSHSRVARSSRNVASAS